MTTKEKIIHELNENQNKAVSGERMAQICGISRAAIWKAINSLRQDGFDIIGTTNGGYLLKNSCDVFSEFELENYIKKNFPSLYTANNGIKMQEIYTKCFKEIDSTNTFAKKLLSENPNVKTGIIAAESQTAGRGRLGRTFYSPIDSGIYLSVIFSPENGVTQPARLTASAAVAVCRAIKKLYGIESSIKWINDIFVNGKKVSGILTEGFTDFETGIIESAVIGIGVNISDNPDCFPEDVKKIAGSILGSNGNGQKNNKNPSRCDFAAEIAGQVLSVLTENPCEVMKEYKEKSFLIGSDVRVFPLAGGTESYCAKVVNIDENAGLVVQLSDGTEKTLTSGEVTLHSDSF